MAGCPAIRAVSWRRRVAGAGKPEGKAMTGSERRGPDLGRRKRIARRLCRLHVDVPRSAPPDQAPARVPENGPKRAGNPQKSVLQFPCNSVDQVLESMSRTRDEMRLYQRARRARLKAGTSPTAPKDAPTIAQRPALPPAQDSARTPRSGASQRRWPCPCARDADKGRVLGNHVWGLDARDRGTGWPGPC